MLSSTQIVSPTSHKTRATELVTSWDEWMKDSVYADMEDLEKQVADYLRELDLWWVYEFPVFVYDEKKRPRVWTPDFYIPKLGMHVEVCGKEREHYEGYARATPVAVSR